MSTITTGKYQKGQEEAIYQLVKRVYDEFVAIDYCIEGNNVFYDWIQPSKIAERQLDQVNVWVAYKDKELVGVIEIRDNKYISLLFVDRTVQRQGIAKKLVNGSLEEIIQRNPAIDKFYVHASPYSIPVYKKMGFREMGDMREENGIKYLPMELTIKR